MGLPSLRAWAVFLLALWTSLHTVPLETPILCPASSCDRPSRSTRRKASSSASSSIIGSNLCGGFGVNSFTGGVIPNMIGLGSLPLLPHLNLWRNTQITTHFVISI